MKITSEVNVMGEWEIIIETKNAQEQAILKEKIDEIGAEFIESGTSEVIVYANGGQKLRVNAYVSNNEKI